MNAPMDVDELRRCISEDAIDTVVLAMPDMNGRLQGKRLDAQHFLEDISHGGLHACSYLLTRDVEMEFGDGYHISGWSNGLNDFVLAPDLATLRSMPWAAGTVLVLADTVWDDGSPVVQSPRHILRQQLNRLAQHGWTALVATELEFLLFENTYRDAFERNYHNLRPATYFDVDYSIAGTNDAEPLLREIRRAMRKAGMPVEGVTGECNFGQFELGFKYAEALSTCDNHVIYKEGVKAIASQHGQAATFMAKYNQGAGNSCHVHLSLVDESGRPVFAGPGAKGFSKTFEHFLAGQLATARDFSLMVAPNVNSYKRFQAGSMAPTTLQWGRDNRTCAIRVLGSGSSLRLENRTPGGDVNPYLGVAAIIAGGLYGVENELPLEPEVVGNAYTNDAARMPTSFSEALGLWQRSAVAEKTFGSAVVHHYATAALQELASYETTVTDWELRRGFERM